MNEHNEINETNEINEINEKEIDSEIEVDGEFEALEEAEALQEPEPEPQPEHQVLESIPQTAKKKSNWRQITALVLIGSTVGGFSVGAGTEFMKAQFGGMGIYGPAYVQSNESMNPSSTSDQQLTGYNNGDKDIVNIADAVGPSVIAITSKVAYQDYFNNVSYSEGAGSGVIFKKDAEFIYILTNNHVIDNAEELVVEVKKNTFANATVVGKDRSTDVAIIKIAIKDMAADVAKALKPAVFGNSDALRVGETAIAIGNPLGYNNSVTVGVISALDRELKAQNSLKLIQTDAAINPGNSGGALVNGQGEVIGINSIKISNEQVEGIGFSIPINAIKPLIEEILSKGYISRPYLGIMGADISKEASELYEIPIGVMVRSVVEGSGAAKGGVKEGDIIISVNNTRINAMTDLSSVLVKLKIGETVKVKVVRDQSKNITLNVILQDSNK